MFISDRHRIDPQLSEDQGKRSAAEFLISLDCMLFFAQAAGGRLMRHSEYFF